MLGSSPGSVSGSFERNRFGLKKKLNKSAVDEAKAKADPFLFLGSGMVAYRSMLEVFIAIFFLLSFIAALMISVYVQYDGVSNPIGYTSWSLANMGSSTA